MGYMVVLQLMIALGEISYGEYDSCQVLYRIHFILISFREYRGDNNYNIVKWWAH